jgi:hypothetical protein
MSSVSTSGLLIFRQFPDIGYGESAKKSHDAIVALSAGAL